MSYEIVKQHGLDYELIHRRIISTRFDEVKASLEEGLAHIQAQGNPHSVDLVQAGLDKLNNYAIASQRGAIEVPSSEEYVDLYAAVQFVSNMYDSIAGTPIPSPESPLAGAEAANVTPTLTAGVYSNAWSENRSTREFQVIETGGDWETPVWEGDQNSDSIVVGEVLDPEKSYLWRCRDVPENGYPSYWSIPEAFTVSLPAIAAPTITGSPVLGTTKPEGWAGSFYPEGTEHFAMDGTQAVGSAFDAGSTGDVHVATAWRIRVFSGLSNDTLIENDYDTEHLTSITIPRYNFNNSYTTGLRTRVDIEMQYIGQSGARSQKVTTSINLAGAFLNADDHSVENTDGVIPSRPVFHLPTFETYGLASGLGYYKIIIGSNSWEINTYQSTFELPDDLPPGDHEIRLHIADDRGTVTNEYPDSNLEGAIIYKYNLGTFTVQSDSSYFVTSKTSNTDPLASKALAEDGTHVYTADVSVSFSDKFALLTKWTKAGDVVWGKKIEGPDDTHDYTINDLCVLGGNLYLVGNWFVPGGNGIAPWIASYDDTGTERWSLVCDESGVFNSITTDGTHLFACGSVNGSAVTTTRPGDAHMALVKFDTSGSRVDDLTTKFVPDTTNSVGEFTGIGYYDSKLVLTAWSRGANGKILRREMFLGADLTFISSRTTDGVGNGGYGQDSKHTTIVLPGGDVLALGCDIDNGGASWVRRSGTTSWWFKIGTSDDYFTRMFVDNDSYYLVGGNWNTYAGWVVRGDLATGAIQWSKAISFNDEVMVSDGFLANGELYVSGSVFDYSAGEEGEAFLLRFGKDGSLGSAPNHTGLTIDTSVIANEGNYSLFEDFGVDPTIVDSWRASNGLTFSATSTTATGVTLTTTKSTI